MYPNETAEHHRDHRCRNKEVNQFCYDPISKYRGNFVAVLLGITQKKKKKQKKKKNLFLSAKDQLDKPCFSGILK